MNLTPTCTYSHVHSPSTPPVFTSWPLAKRAAGCMIRFPRPSPSTFAFRKLSKTGGVEGLGTRLLHVCVDVTSTGMQGVVTAIHFVLRTVITSCDCPKQTACDHMTTLLNCQWPCDHGENPLWPRDCSEKYKPHPFHSYITIYGVTIKVAPLSTVFIGVSTSWHVTITSCDYHMTWPLHPYITILPADWSILTSHDPFALQFLWLWNRSLLICHDINGFDMMCQGSQAMSICATFLFENSVANLR